VAELTEVAGGRADLLAEHAGIVTGVTEGKLAMPRRRGRSQRPGRQNPSAHCPRPGSQAPTPPRPRP
jgi:hypothetical protein